MDEYTKNCQEQEVLCRIEDIVRAKARMDHDKSGLSNFYGLGTYENKVYADEAFNIMEKGNE